MLYIHDPGPGSPVATFAKANAAEQAHIEAGEVSRLYSFDLGSWCELAPDGRWVRAYPSIIAMKVIEVALGSLS